MSILTVVFFVIPLYYIDTFLMVSSNCSRFPQKQAYKNPKKFFEKNVRNSLFYVNCKEIKRVDYLPDTFVRFLYILYITFLENLRNPLFTVYQCFLTKTISHENFWFYLKYF